MLDKYMQFGLVLLLLLLSFSARAASFYMDGVCYGDTAVLVDAWLSKFPHVDDAAGAGGVMSFVSNPTTVSATGVLVSRVDRLNLATGAVTTGVVFSTQLKDCTANSGFVSAGRIDRTLIVIGAVFAVLFGFNVGRKFFPDKFGMGA